MTTMTHSETALSRTRDSVFVRAALIVFFWIIAAALVVGAHASPGTNSYPVAVAVKVGAVIAAAFLYMRLTARKATVDQALFVGIVWLLLDIATEITATSMGGKAWFDLIGSPDRPAIRDLLLFTWVAAPALFARYPSVKSIQ